MKLQSSQVIFSLEPLLPSSLMVLGTESQPVLLQFLGLNCQSIFSLFLLGSVVPFFLSFSLFCFFPLNLFLRILHSPVQEQTSSEKKSMWHLFFRAKDIIFLCVMDGVDITICTWFLSLFCISIHPTFVNLQGITFFIFGTLWLKRK